MARRRGMYGKRRKINYKRIILLVLLLTVAVFAVSLLFRKNDYIGVIEDVIKSDINEISGTVNKVSDVDVTVYSNKGIRYTNQHENIIRLNSFDNTSETNTKNSDDIKLLLENLVLSKETVLLDDLPKKDSAYYWIDADVTVKDEKLFFKDEEKYNFDLYYDIEDKNVFIKEKYYSEFSTKNSKQKLQGYEATEEFIKTIEKLIK